jgi:hypothetical protein
LNELFNDQDTPEPIDDNNFKEQKMKSRDAKT